MCARLLFANQVQSSSKFPPEPKHQRPKVVCYVCSTERHHCNESALCWKAQAGCCKLYHNRSDVPLLKNVIARRDNGKLESQTVKGTVVSGKVMWP